MKDSGVEWLGEVPEHWEIMGLAKTTLLLQTGPLEASWVQLTTKARVLLSSIPPTSPKGHIDTSCGPFIAMNKAFRA